ncbi:ribosome silencing factor [Cellulosimicrobium cellulans]|uniref:ribosome silencing factor n=1 Tax=Cellulosimicrobium cellulans TaxID=1710 RepID=UPI001BAAAA24|nr:ribosome silencing factor [Cellulosimicrobium cellulans]QUC00290.1 ribosome silencing factor [Cellulosimicrobium cellulans]
MTATDRALELAVIAARAASDRKAEEIIALDVSEQLVLTDVFLIASGSSERQVSAIVDAVEEAMHKAGSKPIRREGKQEARWVLLDFGDVVVHVQHAEDRVYYALERLWKDCPVVELPEDARGGDGTADDTDDTARGDGAIRLSGEPLA